MRQGFELVEHTADLGLRAWGPSLEAVFEEAARGLFSVICDPFEMAEEMTLEVRAEAEQTDLLLVAWLNELLYLFDAQHVLFAEFDVRELTPRSLVAVCRGERLDPGHHVVCGGVKAATLHQLHLEQSESGAEAFVILDV